MKRTLLILMLVLMVIMTACSNQTKYPESTQPPESETTTEPTTEPEETTEPEPEVIPYKEQVDRLGLYENRNFTIAVASDGSPAFHVNVKLIGHSNENETEAILHETLTDVHGNANLFYDDGFIPVYIEVAGTKIPVTDAKSYETEVESARAVDGADILFMIPKSESMEKYQPNINDSIAALHSVVTNMNIPIRTAYDFYTSESAETSGKARFTADGIAAVNDKPIAAAGEFSEILNTISSYDYDADTISVAFILLNDTVIDDTFAVQPLLEAARTCAAKGIQVVPIVLGTDEDTRTVATTIAAMTNAPYIRVDTMLSNSFSSICKTVINNLCGVE